MFTTIVKHLSATPAYKLVMSVRFVSHPLLYTSFKSFHFMLSVCSVILSNHYTYQRWDSNPHELSAQQILSLSCLPFHHFGIYTKLSFQITIQIYENFLSYPNLFFFSTLNIFIFLSFVCLSDGLIRMSILFFQR